RYHVSSHTAPLPGLRPPCSSGRVLGDAAPVLLTALQRMALLLRPSRELAPPRPRGEVGGRFGFRDALDPPFDPDLLAERPPVEDQGRTRILLELAGLAAHVTAVEDEAPIVGALQQDHPRRRSSVRTRGRERHRLGDLDTGLLGFLEPLPETLDRVVRH